MGVKVTSAEYSGSTTGGRPPANNEVRPQGWTGRESSHGTFRGRCRDAKGPVTHPWPGEFARQPVKAGPTLQKGSRAPAKATRIVQ